MSDFLSMTAAQVEGLPEDKAAEVLAAWVKAKQTGLPEALAGSKSKAHARLAKKALYQLKSSGTAVAEPKPQGAPVALEAPKDDEELLGTMSPILGTGERALFFARPIRGGGIEIFQAIISDEFGVMQFDRAQTNRATYKNRIRELKADAEVSLVFLPFEQLLEELCRARALNDRSGTNIPQEMADALNRLGVVAKDPDWPVPTPEAGDAKVDSAKLHDESEILQWMPPEKELKAMADEAAEVKGDAGKQAERAAARAASFFTPPMRQLYGRRLWKMAELFEATGRAEAASIARATARHLFHGAEATGFATRLFVKAFELASKPSQADAIKALLNTAPTAPKLVQPK